MRNQMLTTLAIGLGLGLALSACQGDGPDQQCRSAEELCENPEKQSPEGYPGCGLGLKGNSMMCADLSSCALHCGACGNACPEGVDCVDGRCEVSQETAGIYDTCANMPDHRLCIGWNEAGSPKVEVDDPLWAAVLRAGTENATIRTSTTATIASTFTTFNGKLQGECVDTMRSMENCGGCGEVCDGRACVRGHCLPNSPLLRTCSGMCDKASCCPDLPGFDCEAEPENHDFTCVKRVTDVKGPKFVCVDTNTAIGVFGCSR